MYNQNPKNNLHKIIPRLDEAIKTVKSEVSTVSLRQEVFLKLFPAIAIASIVTVLNLFDLYSWKILLYNSRSSFMYATGLILLSLYAKTNPENKFIGYLSKAVNILYNSLLILEIASFFKHLSPLWSDISYAIVLFISTLAIMFFTIDNLYPTFRYLESERDIVEENKDAIAHKLAELSYERIKPAIYELKLIEINLDRTIDLYTICYFAAFALLLLSFIVVLYFQTTIDIDLVWHSNSLISYLPILFLLLSSAIILSVAKSIAHYREKKRNLQYYSILHHRIAIELD